MLTLHTLSKPTTILGIKGTPRFECIIKPVFIFIFKGAQGVSNVHLDGFVPPETFLLATSALTQHVVCVHI